MSNLHPRAQKPSIEGPTAEKHQSAHNRLNFAKEFIRIVLVLESRTKTKSGSAPSPPKSSTFSSNPSMKFHRRT